MLQPDADDVELAAAFLRRVGDAELTATADDGRRCDRCHFYLDPAEPLSLCWHPGLQTAVGAAWSCRHFVPSPTEDADV